MSTIRDDGSTIPSGVTPGSSGGTVRGGGPDITSGMHGAFPASTGISLKPGDPLPINSVIYQYQGVISRSTGEAEVFLLSRNDKKCVFKLYYPNFKPKEDIVKRLKQINHADIINVLDYGYYNDDRFFEIMDYAEGGTIEKHLPIKDIARVKQIIAETISAFKFCHVNGIIHKDIKPQNLYYKNVDGSNILIGDFGISTMLEAGISRHLTSQSLTVGYAAPEMYGIGGKAYVGKEVDYYALGITIIHIWDGKNPFAELSIHAISNLTTSGKIRIPEDMPKGLQKLVKGLITIDYTKRWGYDEIQRWLKGEDVPVFFHVKEISHPPYQFAPDETATTAEEMAALLKKYLYRGKKQLYSKKISAWVNLFNQGLSSDLDMIVEDDYPLNQDAGIQKAIYIIDLDQGFIAKNDKECRSAEELADALEADDSLYVMELPDPNHPFYLYLEAHDAKAEADTFRTYFKTSSARKALNTTILELRGGDSFKLYGEAFRSPEDLLKYKDQQYLIAELKDKESRLSLWIEKSKFTEIIKQVDKWRSLNWHDEVTLAYALSQKSTRLLSKETLGALNDTYIIPDELNNALQSNDTWIFFRAIEQFMQLQNTKTLIEKRQYATLLGDSIVPIELSVGIRAATIDRYIAAVNKLKDLQARNLLITRMNYQWLEKCILPKSIHEGLTGERVDAYTEAAEQLLQLQNEKILIERARYTTLLDDSIVPKELDDGIRSATVAQYVAAVKDLKDLQAGNLLFSKAEYQSLKKYRLPRSIREGLGDEDTYAYNDAAALFRELQKKGKLKTKVELTIVYSFIALAIVLLGCGGWYLRNTMKQRKSDETVFLAKEEKKGSPLLLEDFNDNSNLWHNAPSFRIQIKNGLYSIPMQRKMWKYGKIYTLFGDRFMDETNGEKPDRFYGYWGAATKTSLYGNMIMELNIDRISGPEEKYIGIMFGDIVDNKINRAYAFMMNRRGSYKWVQLSNDGKECWMYDDAQKNKRRLRVDFGMKTRISGVDSAGAGGYVLRSLKVVRNRYKIMLYGNNHLLASFRSDGVPLSGKIGITVENGLDADMHQVSVFSIGD